MHTVAPNEEYCPAIHDAHVVDGSLSRSARPARQSTHVDDAGAEMRPEVQAVQDMLPAAEYQPALHNVHAVDGSLSSSMYPAAQSLHDVDPDAEYCPAVQFVQAVAGSESESC